MNRYRPIAESLRSLTESHDVRTVLERQVILRLEFVPLALQLDSCAVRQQTASPMMSRVIRSLARVLTAITPSCLKKKVCLALGCMDHQFCRYEQEEKPPHNSLLAYEIHDTMLKGYDFEVCPLSNEAISLVILVAWGLTHARTLLEVYSRIKRVIPEVCEITLAQSSAISAAFAQFKKLVSYMPPAHLITVRVP